MNLKNFLSRPWRGLREAQNELAKSEADVDEVHRLADDLREIHRENHITVRIHAAFRGEHQ